jgi:hypothetical protein
MTANIKYSLSANTNTFTLWQRKWSHSLYGCWRERIRSIAVNIRALALWLLTWICLFYGSYHESICSLAANTAGFQGFSSLAANLKTDGLRLSWPAKDNSPQYSINYFPQYYYVTAWIRNTVCVRPKNKDLILIFISAKLNQMCFQYKKQLKDNC